MNNRLLTGLTAAAIAAVMAVASPVFARGGHGGFGGARFAHAAIGPRFAGAGWHGHHGFLRHHHFRRFAVFGAPYFYAGYNDGCWRRSWTPYGWQWVNVCGDYW